jgi:hypothetical protein
MGARSRETKPAALVVGAWGHECLACKGVVSYLTVACSGVSERVSSNSGGASGASGGAGGNGGADATGAGGTTSDTTTRKRVFHLKNGTLGQIPDANDPRTGLEVADAECTKAGQAHGGVQWKAWLSSSTVSALNRIADVGPWYRLDQTTLLFHNLASIVNGPLVPISPQSDVVDDTRNLFWTGTLLDGTASVDNCQDWTTYMGLNIATVGRADTSGQGWVDPTPLSCGYYLALLCIEQ